MEAGPWILGHGYWAMTAEDWRVAARPEGRG